MAEFNDLLHGTTRIRDLPSIPDGDEFNLDREKRHPLCTFHLDEVRAREIHEMLELVATKTKIKMFREREKYKSAFECDLGPPQGFYFDKMQKFAENLPTVELTAEWTNNITNLVPEALRTKYEELFEIHIKETKERYRKAMHDLGMQSVISQSCGCEWPLIVDPPFKLPGRTENYEKFLRNRCSLMRRYFLPHKLMKNIFLKSRSLLPKFICDFGLYRPLGFLTLSRFLDLVDTDMKKGALAVEKTYYTEIVKLVSQPRYIHDIPASMVQSFLQCATKLLAYQIIKLKIKSIRHYLNILSDETKNPLLVIDLQCKDNELSTCPSLDQLHAALHKVLENIGNIAQKLPPLESWVDVRTANEFIPLATPDWYLELSHKRLTEIFEDKYSPLKMYLTELDDQFGVVYDVKTHDDIVAYVAEEHSFEDCLEKLEELNRFVRDINGMTGNEYFVIGKLYQEDAKVGLKHYTEQVRELIIQQLVKRHRNLNLEICGAFEELRKRCLDIPENTRELLELGEYMLFATTKLMESLREKIELSLYMLTTLLELTFIDKDHVELNNDTVNWLTRIKPILRQSGTMYEQMKFELEEQLQARATSLQARIEEMFPRFIFLRHSRRVATHNSVAMLKA